MPFKTSCHWFAIATLQWKIWIQIWTKGNTNTIPSKMAALKHFSLFQIQQNDLSFHCPSFKMLFEENMFQKKNQTSFIVNDTTVPVFAVWQRNLRFGFIYHSHKWIRFVWLLLFYIVFAEHWIHWTKIQRRHRISVYKF